MSAGAPGARDVFVSVFEANIRGLGGLLSAHRLAADPQLRIYDTALHCPAVGDPNAEGADARCAEAMCGTASRLRLGNGARQCLLPVPPAGADGQLLAMATELGTRLLPAFDTPTGSARAPPQPRHGPAGPLLAPHVHCGRGDLPARVWPALEAHRRRHV